MKLQLSVVALALAIAASAQAQPTRREITKTFAGRRQGQ